MTFIIKKLFPAVQNHSFKKIALLISIPVIIFSTSCELYSQETAINSVRFEPGNRTFDDGTLSGVIAFKEGSKYTHRKIKKVNFLLARFYQDNGFFDVAVSDTLVASDEKTMLVFNIIENKRYGIDTLKYEGLDLLAPELKSSINSDKIHNSDPETHFVKVFPKNDTTNFFQRDSVVLLSYAILDTLKNNGYVNASLSGDTGTIVYVNKNDKKVNVTLCFTGVRQRYEYRDDNFKFKIMTDDKLLRNVKQSDFEKFIILNKGGYYSSAEVLKEKKYIDYLDIVRNSKITNDTVGSKVTIKNEIFLNDKDDFYAYFKFATSRNVNYWGGGIKYLDRFALGTNTLSLSPEALWNFGKLYSISATALFSMPYFFTRTKTFFDQLSANIYNQEDFSVLSIKNITGVNWFPENSVFYNKISFQFFNELVNTFNHGVINSGTGSVSSDTSFIYLNSGIGILLNDDKTDNPVYNHNGWFHSILFEQSGPFQKFLKNVLPESKFKYSKYIKLYAANKYFKELSDGSIKKILALSLKAGNIFESSDGRDVIPVFNEYKFYSGGSYSVRGWGPGANGILANPNQGGKFLLEGSMELRFIGKELGYAAFLDMGNVWDNAKNFKFSQISLSPGFGVRYYKLTFGILRADIGIKLYNPSAGDGQKWFPQNIKSWKDFFKKFALNVAIGEAF